MKGKDDKKFEFDNINFEDSPISNLINFESIKSLESSQEFDQYFFKKGMHIYKI